MVDSTKTSFIPKQAIGIVPGRVPHRKHFNILSFIGIVVFLCGMILAVGVFLYKGISEKALVGKKEELQALKNSFNQDDITALRALDRRINVSNVFLNQHLSPSLVFDALELRTQHDVSFTDFSYDRRESGSVELVLKGTALRFNTVALESQQLADAAVLTRTIFSDLNVDDKGQVHFTATSGGNTVALAYSVATSTISQTIQDIGTTTATTTDTLGTPTNKPISNVGTTTPKRL